MYAFVMVLGYSRFAYVRITDNMKQETFQECTKKAFEYFGGIPQTILYDNLKSVIVQRDKYGKNQHGFNEKFLDFAKTSKFIPKICKPYRAKTKGKVERFIDYLKGNFYRPLKATLEGSGITKELLNNYLSSWLIKANNRVHQTTKEKPSKLLEEEKSYLMPQAIISIETKQNKVKSTNACLANIDISYFTTLNDYELLLKEY
jgi:transposase